LTPEAFNAHPTIAKLVFIVCPLVGLSAYILAGVVPAVALFEKKPINNKHNTKLIIIFLRILIIFPFSQTFSLIKINCRITKKGDFSKTLFDTILSYPTR
jgi:hypothetical protein